MERLQQEGFLRLRQIIGDRNTAAIVPISKSSWYNGIRAGRFPRPLKLGVRTTVWRVSEIRALIDGEMNGAQEGGKNGE